jgi:hypothetical protein
MKEIFEDKMMRVFLSIAIFSGALLFFRLMIVVVKSPAPHIPQEVLNSIPPQSRLAQSVPVRSPALEVRKSAPVAPAENPDSLDSALSEPPTDPSPSFDPVADATPDIPTVAPLMEADKIQIKRPRPKLGKNEWHVGNETGADGAELGDILQNVVSGDVIILTSDDHELDLTKIQIEKLEIRGESHSRIKVQLKKFYSTGFKNLTLKNLEIDCLDSFYSFNFNITLNLENVKISENKTIFSVNGMTQIYVRDSSFSGISWHFKDSTKGKFEHTKMEKSYSLLSLSNHAEVELIASQLYDFKSVAIYSGSSNATFLANNIQVSNGDYALSGNFDSNSLIQNSKFKDLREMTLASSSITCRLCEKYNIKR